jgi:hypothetical protein
MRPVTSLRVKSVISFPIAGATLEPGKRVVIRGAAWSGESGPVTGVDVSVDQGRTWRPANLVSRATDFGWRLWEFPWVPSREGYHSILARARDRRGDVQPVAQEWNPSGYLWNVISRADVQVGTAPGAPPSAGRIAPAVAAPPNFRSTCLVCHDDGPILQQRLTRAQWERELNKMIDWGARVAPQDREVFLEYLLRLRGN